MPFIKIEVQEKEGYNSVVITPRDDDDETRKQLDLILHAILSEGPKRGGAVLGSTTLKIDVKTDNLTKDLNLEL